MKKLIILSAILSLFIASEAGAGCAWVLWERYGGMRKGPAHDHWQITDSAKDVESCENRLLSLWKSEKKAYSELSGNVDADIYETSAHIVWFKSDSEIFTRDFLCLPDTIDPRAPKQ